MDALLKEALEKSASFITDLNAKYCIEKLIEEVDRLQYKIEDLESRDYSGR